MRDYFVLSRHYLVNSLVEFATKAQDWDWIAHHDGSEERFQNRRMSTEFPSVLRSAMIGTSGMWQSLRTGRLCVARSQWCCNCNSIKKMNRPRTCDAQTVPCTCSVFAIVPQAVNECMHVARKYFLLTVCLLSVMLASQWLQQPPKAALTSSSASTFATHATARPARLRSVKQTSRAAASWLSALTATMPPPALPQKQQVRALN